MPIFYSLHHVFLPNTDNFARGKRNCATFIIGSIIYSVIYGVMMHLKYLYGKVIDAMLSVLTCIICADVAVMAIEYKIYYGRSIIHEIGDDSHDEFKFNDLDHKYTRTTQDEIDELQKQKQVAKEETRLAQEKKMRIARIFEDKERIRAAKVIQRWWRAKLYNPPNGIAYLRSKRDFCVNQN